MAAGNQVTLTFAGESSSAEKAFSRVGESSERMSDQVRQSGESFDRAGEAADNLDTKAMGFRDSMTGVQDTMGGVAALSKGNLFEGFLMLGFGLGDLGSAFYNLIIPMAKSTYAMVAQRTAAVASATGSYIASAATTVWSGAQWLLNAAFIASPIGWIVLGILALIAVIVLIATQTDWFGKAWNATWSWIKNIAADFWNWFKQIPGWIGSAFSKVGDAIAAPYRWAFRNIAWAWNNTIGRLSWRVPSWVPGIGGNSISVPNLPTFHTGGVVPGAPGTEMLALLQAGERVTPAGQVSSGEVNAGDLRMGGGGGLDRMFLTWLEQVLRRNRLKLVSA